VNPPDEEHMVMQDPEGNEFVWSQNARLVGMFNIMEQHPNVSTSSNRRSNMIVP
jgi:hypothetical protein